MYPNIRLRLVLLSFFFRCIYKWNEFSTKMTIELVLSSLDKVNTNRGLSGPIIPADRGSVYKHYLFEFV